MVYLAPAVRWRFLLTVVLGCVRWRYSSVTVERALKHQILCVQLRQSHFLFKINLTTSFNAYSSFTICSAYISDTDHLSVMNE